MKKIISLALTFLLSFACCAVFAGCGEKDGNSKDKKFKVGICQLAQHEALDAATEGFKAALVDKLGKDNVEFDLQNAAGDSATCATIVNQFVADSADLIMANATPALQAAAAATADIPIVGTSVSHFGIALDIDNFTDTTGINVTGTSDLVSLKDQSAAFKEILPDVKKVGIVYCSAEANSKYQSVEMNKELTALGYTVKDFTFADSNDIATVVTTACDECDALYIPTDNTAASNAEIIDNIASPAGVPIFAGEGGICSGCGIATLSIKYYDIGYQAGVMAAEILKDGKDITKMAVQNPEKYEKVFSKERCEKLNIKVPDTFSELK